MKLSGPFQFLVFLVAGWLSRAQGEAIEYLRAENRVLRSRLGSVRLRFTDGERRLLAEKGRPLDRKRLQEVASLAKPETILRWYRELVAAKYEGTKSRQSSPRLHTRGEAVKRLLTMAQENLTRARGSAST